MATPYNGNPNAVESPSAAPGPGVIPTKSLPAGTDALTVESLYQDMKVDADFIGHIQSAVRLERPLIPAAGSGFTAVTYNSFGGTVTPSGNVSTFNGTRIVIKIIGGGAVGTATFQTSQDGGNTYGATQTTAASMTDATSAITLAFAGTFLANGTAAFQSAYTPRLRLLDSNLNGRWQLDHNGLPTGGRISQFREEWPYVVDPLAAPQTHAVWSGTPWTYDVATAGAINVLAPSASYNARYLQLTPTSTVGQPTALWGPPLFLANTSGITCVVECEVGLNAAAAGTSSKVDFWWGLDDGADDPGSNANAIALYKAAATANYQMAAIKASAVTLTPTTVAPTAGTFPTDRLRIEIQGSGSVYGAYQALFFVNEALVGVVAAANLPSAVALRPVFSAYTDLGAPVGSPLMYVGPLTVTWNRFLNGPGL